MINKLNLKTGLALTAFAAGTLFFAGCQKEAVTGNGLDIPTKKVTLTENQKRQLQDMESRLPNLRYYDQVNNRFIDFDLQNRDWTFSDPDEGFTFDDPDQNGVIVYVDGDQEYIVFSSGIGVAGQGGGGTVVAGNSALDMDVTICLSAEMVAEGDGLGDIFDSGFAFDEFAAVWGIAGDFEALAEADTDSDDFDPFEYFHGFAAYYVLADEISGDHEVFDWLDANGDEDYEDMASSYVMDFQNMSLYFATEGNINVSGGTMTFNGIYLAIEDLFLEFFDEEGEITISEVSGYGSMGCN